MRSRSVRRGIVRVRECDSALRSGARALTKLAPSERPLVEQVRARAHTGTRSPERKVTSAQI